MPTAETIALLIITAAAGLAYGALAYRLRGYSAEWQTRGRLMCCAMPCLIFVAQPITFLQPGTIALLGLDLTPHVFPLAFLAWSYLGLITGHGRFYRLGYEPKPEDRPDNWPAFLPRLLGIPRDTWEFNAMALAITGLAFTLPAFVWLCLSHHYLLGALVWLAGLSKAYAYDLSWRTGYSTEGGEFLHGATLGMAFAICWFLL